MTRNYQIKWYETKNTKYEKDPFYRINSITLSKPTGRTNIDAKSAINIFCKNFGNLRKNTIVFIKEFDENGQIGEDIVPSTNEDAIIPIKK